MNISELWNIHRGATIYIVGTGPSLRLYPPDFFQDKLTIGLNQVWKNFPKLTYFLTIHPEHIPITTKQKIKIVTKRKGNLTGQEPYYFFSNNTDVKEFTYALPSDRDVLYVGRGIHTGAMTLAAKMGARVCYLAGCDLGPLGLDHHATNQEVQFHGLKPEDVYKEYYYNARRLRTILESSYSIRFFSVSPFLGKYWDDDYEYLRTEKNLEPQHRPTDVSTYVRSSLDFTS